MDQQLGFPPLTPWDWFVLLKEKCPQDYSQKQFQRFILDEGIKLLEAERIDMQDFAKILIEAHHWRLHA